MASKARILVVEDDDQVRAMLREYLATHEFEVDEAHDGEAMRCGWPASARRRAARCRLARRRWPCAGPPPARALRRWHYHGHRRERRRGPRRGPGSGRRRLHPQAVRSPRAARAPEERAATPAGATDRQRSPPAPASARAAVGRCVLDLAAHQLFDDAGEEIPITGMEFDLLRVFAERPNQVLSRDQLLTLTRNREWEPFDRSIDIRIARLRRKLEATPKSRARSGPFAAAATCSSRVRAESRERPRRPPCDVW